MTTTPEGSTAPTSSQLSKKARARALASAVWILGAAVIGVLAVVGGEGTNPGGRALQMVGVLVLVGIAPTFALVATNASLTRHPERTDARGISDVLTLLVAVLALATIALVPLFSRTLTLSVVAVAVIGVMAFLPLLVMCLLTRGAAVRRSPGRP